MPTVKSVAKSVALSLMSHILFSETILNYFTGCQFSVAHISDIEWIVSSFLIILTTIVLYKDCHNILKSLYYLMTLYLVNGFIAYALRSKFTNDFYHLVIFTACASIIPFIIVALLGRADKQLP